MKRGLVALAAAGVVALVAGGASAGLPAAPDPGFAPRPDAVLPLGAALVDEEGRPVTLGRYFTGSPVVLVLEYLRCKTFCGLTLSGLMSTLGALPLAAGRDYQLVAISIDPRDSAADNAAAKAKYLALFGRPGGAAGFHFLGGTEAQVRAVADAIGFHYRYDAALDQYTHPAGFIVATPDGRIGGAPFGIAASPAELQQAIGDAAEDRPPSPLRRFILLCHVEGAPLGRFTVPVLAALTGADIVAGLCLIALFARLGRRRRF